MSAGKSGMQWPLLCLPRRDSRRPTPTPTPSQQTLHRSPPPSLRLHSWRILPGRTLWNAYKRIARALGFSGAQKRDAFGLTATRIYGLAGGRQQSAL